MVTLSKTEQEVAALVADKRYKTARAAGVKNQKKGPQSNEYTDLNGFGGELAVAKTLNTYPELTMDASAGGVDGEAFYRAEKLTYDVKTTKYPDGHVIVKPETAMKEHADLFILVTGEMPEYEVRGFIEAEEIFQQKYLKDLGRGRCLAVPQSDLKSMKLLS